MKKVFKFAIVIAAILSVSPIIAQRATMLRINEVMSNNQDNYMDDYGKKSPWIEIFNSSPATVNLAGCYLTDDLSNPKKYMISKGDVLTRVKAHQHIVFWADDMSHHGTFHLNFKFNPDTTNFIALFDANGTTLIDSVSIPKLMADKTWGRKTDGDGVWQIMDKVTPSTNNTIITGNESIEKFKENDPTGSGMAITAMSVVFLALIVLYLLFKSIGKIAVKIGKKNAAKSSGTIIEGSHEVSGEVFAAISMALHEFQNDAHDIEETVLTINRVTRNYSPWSSKIYGLREMPQKK